MSMQADLHDVVPAKIAIIGMACRFPGADSLDQYWRNLREGVESIRTFSEAELVAAGVPQRLIDDVHYVRASAPISDAAGFDAGYFGYVARDVELMDPQHRIFLECAVWALEDAGYDPARCDELVGVYGGCTMNTYLLVNLMAARHVIEVVGDHALMIGNDKDYLPLRVAYKLGLRGPACAVQTACSTSLTAVHLAAQAILAGECDMALAGGSSLRVPHGAGYLQNATASPDGHCRAFDADALGSVLGNGAGVVVLKHLDDARRDGDHIYAVIQGTATTNDGAKATFTAPTVDGQARAAAGALAAAGLSADDIDYVEAHGTGTPLGDPIEVTALTKAFRLTSDREQDCAIGSVKPNIGHLDAAAGIAGLIKTVLALGHQAIPPVLHFRTPNPHIDFESSPFYVPDSLEDWPATEGRPRRAGVHSIGMGGSNVHVVLEEAAPGEPAPGESRPAQREPELILLSARTPAALDTMAGNLSSWLREHPEVPLGDVAFTLQTGRRVMAHRCSVVARDAADAAIALGTPGSPRLVTSDTREPAQRTAFLFPGQGSQYQGMAGDLYQACLPFRAVADECLAMLPGGLAESVRGALLGRRTGAKSLTDTALAQPALFIVEYALARALESWGVVADVMLGHSIGEYVAATLAGVFTLRDALPVVAARGQLISRLPGGAMIGVPVAEEAARELIAGLDLSLAAINGDSLVVVSGADAEIDKFSELLAGQRIPGKRLHVSHAFHSAMLDPALPDFESVVRAVPLSAPDRTVISNVSGTFLEEGRATDPRYWVDHLRQPVRFGDGLRAAAAHPGTVLVEVGPGRQLASLARQQHAARAISLLPGAQDKPAGWAGLLRGLGDLWHAGGTVDWRQVPGKPRRRVSLPTYPFERAPYWISPVSTDLADRDDLQTREADPADWVYEPRWTESPAPSGTGTPPSRVLLLRDDAGCGAQLADQLRRNGASVLTVARAAAFSADGASEIGLDPSSPQDWQRLGARIAELGFVPDAVVHLWTLDLSSEDGFDQEQDRGAHSLPRLLSVLPAAYEGAGGQLLYVTRHVFDLSGEDPMRPGLMTAVGLCRVIPQETSLRCRVLEADPRPLPDRAAALADDLSQELAAGPAPSPLALRGRRRYLQQWTRIPLPAQARRTYPGAHLVIGGLGQVGATLAERLLADQDATVTVYDSAAPDQLSPAQQENLARLRKAGADRFALVSADVTDAQSLGSAVRSIAAQHGRIGQVIYAPGVPVTEGIAAIGDFGPASLGAQLATKAWGLRTLDAALAGVPVDRCTVIGSLATVLGGIGLSAYTAANAYLDSYVELRVRDSGIPWVSMRWGHWATGQPGLREDQACTPEQACQIFDAVSGMRPAGPVAVSIADLSGRAAKARTAELRRPDLIEPAQAQPAAGSAGPRSRPAIGVAYVAPRDELESEIARIWTELLGFDQIGVLDSFFELGGESLTAMQLLTRLRAGYEVDLPLDELFKETTVSVLAELIRSGAHQAVAAAAAQPPDGDAATMRLLGEIEGLSDSDVERELARYRESHP